MAHTSAKRMLMERLTDLAISRGIIPEGEPEDFLAALAADLAKEIGAAGFCDPDPPKPKRGRKAEWTYRIERELLADVDATKRTNGCSTVKAIAILAKRGSKWARRVTQLGASQSHDAVLETLRSRYQKAKRFRRDHPGPYILSAR